MSDIIKELERKDFKSPIPFLTHHIKGENNIWYIMDTYSYPQYLLTLFFRSRFPIVAYAVKQENVKPVKEEVKVKKSIIPNFLIILFSHIVRVSFVKLNNSLTPTDIDMYVKILLAVFVFSFILYRVINKRKQVINSFKSLGIKKYKVKSGKRKIVMLEIFGLLIITFLIFVLNSIGLKLYMYDNTYIMSFLLLFICPLSIHGFICVLLKLGGEIEILKELEY